MRKLLFGSASSSGFSSSKTETQKVIEKLNEKKIVSCVLALGKLRWYSFSKECVHASMLLIDTDSGFDDEYRGNGILIEYGDYSPNMSEEEKEAVKKERTIYRYGDKGGLRYYVFNYKEYLEKYGDSCYVSMDTKSDNQMTFQAFIDTIAPPNEDKWIQEKYNVSTQNCQAFAVQALDLLHPTFSPSSIQIPDKNKSIRNKLEIFPEKLQKALKDLK